MFVNFVLVIRSINTGKIAWRVHRIVFLCAVMCVFLISLSSWIWIGFCDWEFSLPMFGCALWIGAEALLSEYKVCLNVVTVGTIWSSHTTLGSFFYDMQYYLSLLHMTSFTLSYFIS